MKLIISLLFVFLVFGISFMAFFQEETSNLNILETDELNNNLNLYFGPVKPGTSEKIFRETGFSVEVSE